MLEKTLEREREDLRKEKEEYKKEKHRRIKTENTVIEHMQKICQVTYSLNVLVFSISFEVLFECHDSMIVCFILVIFM